MILMKYTIITRLKIYGSQDLVSSYPLLKMNVLYGREHKTQKLKQVKKLLVKDKRWYLEGIPWNHKNTSQRLWEMKSLNPKNLYIRTYEYKIDSFKPKKYPLLILH